MLMITSRRTLALGLIAWALFAVALPSTADPIVVRHPEGLVHGFLVLRSATGDLLADGELLQTTQGSVVTSELVFHFKDGSLHDETAVFSQAGHFRLQRYRLRQKGASFPHPLDFSLDCKTGQAKVSSLDADGQPKVDTDRLEKTPQDLANGMLPILLKNVDGRGTFTFSMLAPTPKPRMVTLHVEPAPDDAIFDGPEAPRAHHFVVKVELHGLTGLVAPIVGKQPPDTHFWILPGAFPAFLRAEGALYVGGPIWRIEIASPHWARS